MGRKSDRDPRRLARAVLPGGGLSRQQAAELHLIWADPHGEQVAPVRAAGQLRVQPDRALAVSSAGPRLGRWCPGSAAVGCVAGIGLESARPPGHNVQRAQRGDGRSWGEWSDLLPEGQLALQVGLDRQREQSSELLPRSRICRGRHGRVRAVLVDAADLLVVQRVRAGRLRCNIFDRTVPRASGPPGSSKTANSSPTSAT